ncbi:hypothetical protein PDIDSM_4617 [Penicillium digitatum]|nr:hypothetical protein PDIDSM_4617 [Penicillium digitatum]
MAKSSDGNAVDDTPLLRLHRRERIQQQVTKSHEYPQGCHVGKKPIRKSVKASAIHPHSSPQHPTTHVTYFDNALENKIMDAQLPTTGSQPNQKLRLGSEIQGFGPRSTSDAHSHSGWSIRRLLSRRGGRKYSVLERESNRLRKRMGS